MKEGSWSCVREKKDRKRIYPQNEKDLKKEFIKILQNQGYEYFKVTDRQSLIDNLRKQLAKLNSLQIPDFTFSDNEWNRFWQENFESNSSRTKASKDRKIHGDEIRKSLKRDDGNHVNLHFFNRSEPHRNHIQVIDKFGDPSGSAKNDVAILVNGLPLIYIELKRIGFKLETAFNQTDRYRFHDFPDLFEFIQIFVISNGIDTKYFSNSTRPTKSDKQREGTQNSFVFTSNWSYSNNANIRDIFEFAETFLEKRTILEILAKYCVLDTEQELKVLRPYQITAIERILDQIRRSISMNLSSRDSGGYIWHTTGSGKTLTSFKAAQLAQKIPEVSKVLFVVDRKDLDHQTCQEYRKYLGESSEQSIDTTENTEALRRLLNSNDKKIIITTIQKLRRLLKAKDLLKESLRRERIVIIMDECHRTQTQDTHDLIEKNFKEKNLFGFTGTPIFNRDDEKNGLVNTKKLFGEQLHTYNIVDAISDNNVLKFKVDYVEDKNRALRVLPNDHDQRVEAIVDYIIKNFRIKTVTNQEGDINSLPPQFNSIFAVESIPMAIKYYQEFEKKQKEGKHDLSVSVIFSAYQDAMDDEDEGENRSKIRDDEDLPEDQRQFLQYAIDRHCERFNLTVKCFDDYRSQISKRVKDKEIDILIVVNMFLTGFDAKRLNTLWVDKNLKEHGLIQAFSRTNRKYDRSKDWGNIVCFRDLRQEVDRAIRIFADRDELNTEAGDVLVENFEKRSEAYVKAENHLMENYPPDRRLEGIREEQDYVDAYENYHSAARQMMSEGEAFEKMRKMSSEDRDRYRSQYLEICDRSRRMAQEAEAEGGDPSHIEQVFCDLEIVQSDEIDEHYIMSVISGITPQTSVPERERILAMLKASSFGRKIESIFKEFFANEPTTEEEKQFKNYIHLHKDRRADELIEKYNLQAEGTKHYINTFIDNGGVNFNGDKIRREIMPNNINIRKELKKYLSVWSEVKEEITDICETFKYFK